MVYPVGQSNRRDVMADRHLDDLVLYFECDPVPRPALR